MQIPGAGGAIHAAGLITGPGSCADPRPKRPGGCSGAITGPPEGITPEDGILTGLASKSASGVKLSGLNGKPGEPGWPG